ncbi:MAG: choice-of-anchor A family protein [Ignavibacteriaceae bacterium]
MKQISLLLLLLLAFTSRIYSDVESIAYVSGVDKVSIVTLPGHGQVYAGTFHATINGNSVSLYCIDIANPLATGEPYQDVEQTDNNMSYILNNYYPFKTGYPNMLGDITQEAAAVQLALWHFSDGLVINDVTGSNTTTIKARAQAIIDDALANAIGYNLSYFFFDIVPQTFSVGNPVQFRVKAFNDAGIAMPNVNIALTLDLGTLSSYTFITDETGVSPLITLTPEVGQTAAHMSATGVVGIPSGTKYYHVASPNVKQKLILATPTVASRVITSNINWFATPNVEVIKVADKSAANHGDYITYTITATNTGNGDATTVIVSDQLQPVLDFVSCNPAGVYNPVSGLWDVGPLAAGASATLEIVVKVDFTNTGANIFDLGVAKDYNLFVIEDLYAPSSDTEGKVAVGRDCDLRGYSVGDKLPPNSGNVLVVGNHLTFITGRVYNGNAVYENFITKTTGFTVDGDLLHAHVIDFAQAKLDLEDLSTQLGTLPQTNAYMHDAWHQLELIGTDEHLNVFYVPASVVSDVNSFTIDAPAGSTVLVNITGNPVTMFGGFDVLHTNIKNVILNFIDATDIHVSGINIQATVLAPKAHLDFPVGLITGQVIVKSMTGAGQLNLSPFEGTLTRDVNITNVATLVTANQSNMPVLINPVSSICLVNSVLTPTDLKTEGIIESYDLEQNYPNPFNPSTTITFSIAENDFVSITLYDVTGQLVSTLLNTQLQAGKYSIKLDASHLTSGVYLYRMTTSTYSSVKKMTLQK